MHRNSASPSRMEGRYFNSFESGGKMQTIQRVLSVRSSLSPRPRLWPREPRASAAKINADVRASLDQFFRQTPGARALANNAAGVLVFPTVVRAGSELAVNMARARFSSAAGRSDIIIWSRRRSASNWAHKREPLSSCS